MGIEGELNPSHGHDQHLKLSRMSKTITNLGVAELECKPRTGSTKTSCKRWQSRTTIQQRPNLLCVSCIDLASPNYICTQLGTTLRKHPEF